MNITSISPIRLKSNQAKINFKGAPTNVPQDKTATEQEILGCLQRMEDMLGSYLLANGVKLVYSIGDVIKNKLENPVSFYQENKLNIGRDGRGYQTLDRKPFNGILRFEKDGATIEQKCFNGTISQEKEYDKDGKLVAVANYTYGEHCKLNELEIKDANGNLIFRRIGSTEQNYENGLLKSAYFNVGSKENYSMHFDDNGNIKTYSSKGSSNYVSETHGYRNWLTADRLFDELSRAHSASEVVFWENGQVKTETIPLDPWKSSYDCLAKKNYDENGNLTTIEYGLKDCFDRDSRVMKEFGSHKDKIIHADARQDKQQELINYNKELLAKRAEQK